MVLVTVARGSRVMGDEERFSDEKIELGRAKLFLLVEGHGVHDEKEIILVVLDLGIAAHRQTILDGQGMEGKDIFQDAGCFLGGGREQIDPNEQPLVGAHQPQGVAVEIAGDQLAIVEDKGLNHKTVYVVTNVTVVIGQFFFADFFRKLRNNGVYPFVTNL